MNDLAAGPPAEPVNDTFAGRLGDLVARPGRLMDHVGVAPRWWHAGLLIFVTMGAFAWLTSPISGPEQLEVMRESRLMRMVPEEQWQQQYEEAMDPAPGKRIGTAVGAAFTAWVMVLVFGVILGFFARMGGGKGTFRQAVGVTSWAALLPFVLGSAVKVPLVLATESVQRVNFGLVALAPGLEPASKLYQVLVAYGDFFTWWGLVVLVIGFQRVFAMGRGAAATAVLLPWALCMAVPVGLALLFM
ncbi:MAG: YIP1 family protein [Krumholzibacteria bacterium]|nr:YIP1 family protein [Candidatus Krumholzibacteria bacterium]